MCNKTVTLKCLHNSMIQRIQNLFLHLAMIPVAIVVMSAYAFIALLGLSVAAGLIIGVGEWLSS